MNVKPSSTRFTKGRLFPRLLIQRTVSRRCACSDFFELTKPRVMLLAVFTAVVGLITAWATESTTLIRFLSIGRRGGPPAHSTLYDSDIDAIMAPHRCGRYPAARFCVRGAGLWTVRGRCRIVGSRSRYEPHGSRAVGLPILFYVVRVTAWAEACHRPNIVSRLVRCSCAS